MSSELIRTSYQSPWQNGVAERWVGSCRRELLDHVIVFNGAPLRRLVRDYLGYYHADRIQDGLGKGTPEMRPVERREASHGTLVALPRVDGLHHRYTWRVAASESYGAKPFLLQTEPPPAFRCEHWVGVGDVRQKRADSCHKVVEFKSKDSTPAANGICRPEALHLR